MKKTNATSTVEPKRRRPPKRKLSAEMLTRQQVAEYLGTTAKRLAEMAADRSGPPYAKFGTARNAGVRYPADRLRDWVESHMVRMKTTGRKAGRPGESADAGEE